MKVESTLTNETTGVILSQGNMDVNAENLVNNSSKIMSGGTMVLKSNSLKNIRESFTVDGLGIRMHRKSNKQSCIGCGWKGDTYAEGSYSATLYGNTAAVISSIGSLDIIASKELMVDETNKNIDVAKLFGKPTFDKVSAKNKSISTEGVIGGGLKAYSITTDSLNINVNADSISIGSIKDNVHANIGNIVDIKVNKDGTWGFDPDDISRMYGYNKPDSSYMFETDLMFVDLSLFFGSEYFFNLTGFDNSDNKKSLGDAYFETQLIMNDIIMRTNRPYISDATSGAEQMQILYNNASKQGDKLGLSMGTEPTADQLAKLESDIIWYVTKNINGEDVYVPTLYLCPETLAMIEKDGTGSQILSGGNMEIYAGNVSNSGNIAAAQNMYIEAQSMSITSFDMSSQASISSGGTMFVDVTDALINTGGAISSKGNMWLDAGELVSQTLVSGLSLGGEVRSDLGNMASITSGGSMLISTEKDLAIIGSKVSSDGSMQLKAGEDLVIGGVTTTYSSTTRSASGNGYGGGAQKTETTTIETFYGSEINAGGNMLLSADNDINITGSFIKGDGVVQLQALNDINIYTGVNTTHTASSESTDGIGSSSATVSETLSVKNVGSSIYGAEALVLLAGNDITAISADLKTDGFAYAQADGNITVMGAVDEEYSYSRTDSSSMGGLQSSTSVVVNRELTYQGGNFVAEDALTLISGKDTKIVGSNVKSGGDMGIFAGYTFDEEGELIKSETGGNFYLENAYDESYHYEMYEQTTMLSGIDDINFSCERGGCSVSAKVGERSLDETGVTTETVVKSTLNAGGNLTVMANGDINIIGSDINAFGNAFFEFDKMSVLDAHDTTYTKSKHEQTDIYVSASVGNAYVDAAYAVNDLYEAEKAVEKAQNDLDEMERKMKNGEASQQAVNDAEANLAAAWVNLTTATLNAAAAIAGTAAAASTSYGTGMYAGAGMRYDTESATINESSSVSVGSSINAGGDITFTGNSMVQRGSWVNSEFGDISYNVNSLDFLAGKSTFTSEMEYSQESYSVSAKTSGSANVNASGSKSESGSESVYYTNAGTSAQNGTIYYNVNGDINAEGYNALAKHIDATGVTGNINLVTLQDVVNSSGSGSNWGVGAGKGGDISGSFGSSSNSMDGLWSNSVSSLIGTESVSLNANNLHLTGSIIANIDEDGVDRGNLTINVNKLTWTDLENTNSSNSSGFNVSLSSNVNNGGGNTTLGLTGIGSEKEGMTYSTIGSGNITVNDGTDISGLNRNVDNVQVVTKDQITGALDMNLSVDNRVFTESGRENIKKDFENLPENVKHIAEAIATDNIVSRSIKNAATDSNTSIVGAVLDYVNVDHSETEIQADKLLTAQANGATNLPPEEVQALLQALADIAGANGGFMGELYISNVNGNVIGMAYQDKDGIDRFINIDLANVDLAKPNKLINAIYHETTNFERHSANDRTAENMGDTAEAIWRLKNYGNANTNTMNGDQWLAKNAGSSVLLDGNSNFFNNLNNLANVEGDVNFEVIHLVRNVDFYITKKLEIKHSAVVLIPDNPDDFKPDKIREMGLDPEKYKFTDLKDGKSMLVLGGFKGTVEDRSVLDAQINHPTDSQLAQDVYKMQNLNNIKEFKPEQKTVISPYYNDTEFTQNILLRYDAYENYTKENPVSYRYLFDNSNSFVTNLLNYSGADIKRDNNFNSWVPGNDGKLPFDLFETQKEKDNKKKINEFILNLNSLYLGF
jgi:adhesin HecA-like repeat protein